ncbi:MAG: hypothetical protein A2857_03945 [Candidatus Levybacteria bacterium RIFCSPHIGHO2_01_FULL_36_15]|nr:MAG: hypothetical protein A2857_03945 [Candidatus Levybacteria bacterium RIFCSPHIGHO2_01_FULL_36_15]OGH38531.1 MAG: hypothetical protein A2905_02770 [Candidatus Levybacteria bacterium RIFCSPLOWO2_01_FULL_36_10]
MTNCESELPKFKGNGNINAQEAESSGEENVLNELSGNDVRTIRGNEVKVFDDRVVKYVYSEQEVINLELLQGHSQEIAEAGIRIPTIIQKDPDKGILTLTKLPFGKFPTTSEYFGEGSHDHIQPLHAISRLRAVCNDVGISALLRQYGDNNDYAHFINLVNRQSTMQTAPYIDKFLDQVTRLSSNFPSLPRVVAHRDYTPANIRAVENYGCIMLDMTTFGVSTYGADEGRWYVHHVLDSDKQREILITTQNLNPFGIQGDLAFLLMVGMRSARECKMLEESSYYDRHLQNEFSDAERMSRFKGRLKNALTEQLSWSSENLKQF